MGEPGLLRKTFFKKRAYFVLIFIYESKLKYKDNVTYRLSCVSVLYGCMDRISLRKLSLYCKNVPG